MKRMICLGMGLAFVLLIFGGVTAVDESNIVDKIIIWDWNGYHYAKARLPDGSMLELKSLDEKYQSEWKALFYQQYLASLEPVEPNYPVLFDNVMYSVLEKDVNDLILYWKPEEAKIEITPVKLKALKAATIQMTGVFEP